MAVARTHTTLERRNRQSSALACAKAVNIFIKVIVKLHELRAENFRSDKHHWQLDVKWFEFGFLRKIAKVAGMLTNDEEVKSMLAAVDAEDSKEEATHHGSLCMLHSCADAVALYLGVATQ